MVSAGRHPKKEVAEALRRAEAAGLAVREIHRGHRWGEVLCMSCPARQAVYSTPRNPATHAKIIGWFVEKHRQL
jgi:hypothetical protein